MGFSHGTLTGEMLVQVVFVDREYTDYRRICERSEEGHWTDSGGRVLGLPERPRGTRRDSCEDVTRPGHEKVTNTLSWERVERGKSRGDSSRSYDGGRPSGGTKKDSPSPEGVVTIKYRVPHVGTYDGHVYETRDRRVRDGRVRYKVCLKLN